MSSQPYKKNYHLSYYIYNSSNVFIVFSIGVVQLSLSQSSKFPYYLLRKCTDQECVCKNCEEHER